MLSIIIRIWIKESSSLIWITIYYKIYIQEEWYGSIVEDIIKISALIII